MSSMPKVRRIHSTSAQRTIAAIAEDADSFKKFIAVGITTDEELYFYDSGGSLIETIGLLDYMKIKAVEAWRQEQT